MDDDLRKACRILGGVGGIIGIILFAWSPWKWLGIFLTTGGLFICHLTDTGE